MDVDVAELSLAALDAADVEALVLLVPPEERPLRGLAGLCDWRLCGALSRTIEEGWYRAGPGEVLLTPTRGRIAPARLFVFGLGEAELPRNARRGQVVPPRRSEGGKPPLPEAAPLCRPATSPPSRGSLPGRAEEIGRLLPRVLDALRRARVDSVGFGLPWPGLEFALSLELWAESAGQGPPRQLLLGDPPALRQWLGSRRGAFRVSGQ